MKAGIEKRAPEGWEILWPKLEEIENELREIERDSGEGKRKCEAMWPIFKLHRERSRYVFDRYLDGEISRRLFDFCLREKVADATLIAKWKKNGYEKLCCLRYVRFPDPKMIIQR